MTPHAANVFHLLARALARGESVTLAPGMITQVLAENAYLIEAKNELVRLNYALAERVEIQSGLLSKRAEHG